MIIAAAACSCPGHTRPHHSIPTCRRRPPGVCCRPAAVRQDRGSSVQEVSTQAAFARNVAFAARHVACRSHLAASLFPPPCLPGTSPGWSRRSSTGCAQGRPFLGGCWKGAPGHAFSLLLVHARLLSARLPRPSLLLTTLRRPRTPVPWCSPTLRLATVETPPITRSVRTSALALLLLFMWNHVVAHCP